jgi:hypothetical protein
VSSMHIGAKLFLLGLSLATVAGCASNDNDAKYQEAVAAATAESTRCRDEYPLDRKNAMQRTKCLNRAADLLRPYISYPEITDATGAYNLMLAEQFRAGKITEAEFLAKETERRSQGLAEAERRDLAKRAVSAQESPQAVVVYPMTNTMPVFRPACIHGPLRTVC